MAGLDVARQHRLVEDAYDKDPSGSFAIEDYMLAMFQAVESRADIVALPTERRHLRKLATAALEVVEVTDRLIHAPLIDSESRD